MTKALTGSKRQPRTDAPKAGPEESDHHQKKVRMTEKQSHRLHEKLETEGEDRRVRETMRCPCGFGLPTGENGENRERVLRSTHLLPCPSVIQTQTATCGSAHHTAAPWGPNGTRAVCSEASGQKLNRRERSQNRSSQALLAGKGHSSNPESTGTQKSAGWRPQSADSGPRWDRGGGQSQSLPSARCGVRDTLPGQGLPRAQDGQGRTRA